MESTVIINYEPKKLMSNRPEFDYFVAGSDSDRRQKKVMLKPGDNTISEAQYELVKDNPVWTAYSDRGIIKKVVIGATKETVEPKTTRTTRRKKEVATATS